MISHAFAKAVFKCAIRQHCSQLRTCKYCNFERVNICTCLFPVDGDRQLHEPVPQEVVHVHALAPALLVTDLGLVLEVDIHLGLAGQDVHQPAAVGGRHSPRGTQPDRGLQIIIMNVG